ncbi:MAG: HD-GYP domain-containing protein [Candidatus Izemoplasmatales bacterium]
MVTKNVFTFNAMASDFCVQKNDILLPRNVDFWKKNFDKFNNFKYEFPSNERLKIINVLSREGVKIFRDASDLDYVLDFSEFYSFDKSLIDHSTRVSDIAVRLGKELHLEHKNLVELKIAGMFHDIGKLFIPNEILDKPGKLDEKQLDIIKTHTIMGYEVLVTINQYENIASCVRSHHERMDGTGYPDQKKGEAIPLEARIIAVVDAYEAMTELRPYRTPFTQKQAIKELRKCSGTQFDKKIVNVFVKKVMKKLNN